jgi:hypothetical protein
VERPMERFFQTGSGDIRVATGSPSPQLVCH